MGALSPRFNSVLEWYFLNTFASDWHCPRIIVLVCVICWIHIATPNGVDEKFGFFDAFTATSTIAIEIFLVIVILFLVCSEHLVGNSWDADDVFWFVCHIHKANLHQLFVIANIKCKIIKNILSDVVLPVR